MAKRKASFEEIEVQKQTTVKGGWLSKPLALAVMKVQIGDSKMEFVNLNKRQDWLCRMVSGIACHQRPLARVKLIDTLQAKIKHGLIPEGGEVVADSGDEDGDRKHAEFDDPMNQLGFGEATVPVGRPRTSTRAARKHSKNIVLRAVLPKEPPEKNARCEATYEVSLWLSNRQSVWIGVEHLPWAVQYMHEEYLLGGVSNIEMSPDSSPAKSSDIRWDFSSSCWLATVGTGPNTKERRLKPSSLDPAEASMVVDAGCNVGSMSYEELKSTAYQILLAWVEKSSLD